MMKLDLITIDFSRSVGNHMGAVKFLAEVTEAIKMGASAVFIEDKKLVFCRFITPTEDLEIQIKEIEVKLYDKKAELLELKPEGK